MAFLPPSIATPSLVCASAEMRKLMRALRRSVDLANHLIIVGPSGSGKSRVAGLIHDQSSRRDEPLVMFDAVAAGPRHAGERLLEALELTRSGTLHLDNVHELPFVVQCDLAAVLGSTPARVIAMSHLRLRRDSGTPSPITNGLWRQLRGADIHLPLLRDRIEDIRPLAEDFLREFAAAYAVPVFDFSADTLAKLERYSWPGNVRQLRDVVRRATLLASSATIEPHIITASA